MVIDLKQREEERQNEPIHLNKNIFKYKDETALAKTFKRFLKGNDYGHVQTHDFRVSKATDMYEEHGNIEEIREFFKHTKVEVTWLYVKPPGIAEYKKKLAAQGKVDADQKVSLFNDPEPKQDK